MKMALRKVGSEWPIRVIVADDQAPVRESLEALLEAYEDIEVVAKAADGVEAVRLAESLRPDLVLMDCRMPELDGLEATKLLKELSPEIAILVLSMYQDLEAAAMAAGAESFVAKGSSANDLVRGIREAVESNRQ